MREAHYLVRLCMRRRGGNTTWDKRGRGWMHVRWVSVGSHCRGDSFLSRRFALHKTTTNRCKPHHHQKHTGTHTTGRNLHVRTSIQSAGGRTPGSESSRPLAMSTVTTASRKERGYTEWHRGDHGFTTNLRSDAMPPGQHAHPDRAKGEQKKTHTAKKKKEKAASVRSRV